MLSTKSRLLTRLPGAKKRISIVFSEVKPGTSGQTIGRSSSDTKHSAGCGCLAVNGKRNHARGGVKVRTSNFEKAGLGDASCWAVTRHPPVADRKRPLGVGAVARGIVG